MKSVGIKGFMPPTHTTRVPMREHGATLFLAIANLCISPEDARNIAILETDACNYNLPKDIHAEAMKEWGLAVHYTFEAEAKLQEYLDDERPCPFRYDRAAGMVYRFKRAEPKLYYFSLFTPEAAKINFALQYLKRRTPLELPAALQYLDQYPAEKTSVPKPVLPRMSMELAQLFREYCFSFEVVLPGLNAKPTDSLTILVHEQEYVPLELRGQ